jgi:hypothetical protein
MHELGASLTNDSIRSVASDRLESKIGRVTGQIAPGAVGEVRLPYQGGTETFNAYAWDDGEVIEVGAQVVVVDRVGPRSVKVSRFSY